ADFVFDHALRPIGGGPTAFAIPISRYDTLLDAYLRLGFVGSLGGSGGGGGAGARSGPAPAPLSPPPGAPAPRPPPPPGASPPGGETGPGARLAPLDAILTNALSRLEPLRSPSPDRFEAAAQRVTTVVTRAADRLEDLADRVGQRADTAPADAQPALRRV